MIGISFGEILIIVIIACLFFKPEEIVDNITKMLKKVQDIKEKGTEILNETLQIGEIKDIKSDLEKMYKEMTISPILLEDIDKIEDIQEFYHTTFDGHNEKADLTQEEVEVLTSSTNIANTVNNNQSGREYRKNKKEKTIKIQDETGDLFNF